jgi:hypothetical protein
LPAGALALQDGAASKADVQSIVEEITLTPSLQRIGVKPEPGQKPLGQLPFSAKVLAAYRPDGDKSITELRKQQKDDPAAFAKRFPNKAVVLDAIEALQKTGRVKLAETLVGPLNPKTKAAFLNQQAEPGTAILELQGALSEMQRLVEKNLITKASKRWQAHFDLTQSRLRAQIAYLYEYGYMLGQIRRDDLPPLPKEGGRWRLVPRPKVQVPEAVAKAHAKEAAIAWKAIQEAYPDSPWAVAAERESQTPLGLEWQVRKD